MRGSKVFELGDNAHVNISQYGGKFVVKVYGFGNRIPAALSPGLIGSFPRFEDAHTVANAISDFTGMRVDLPRSDYINLS